MPTIKQRRLAQKVIENTKTGEFQTIGEMLESVGYAKTSATRRPGQILQSEGVIEALEEFGFTEDNAKKVVGQILLDKRVKPDTRIRAAQEVFKVHGSYKQPEETPKPQIHLHLDLSKFTPEQIANFAQKGVLNAPND